MSTVTHKPKVSNRQLVDAQIRTTRRTLKLVDLLAGILTLTIGLLVFLLVTALLEHWVVSGGWNQAARSILFILLSAGVTWYGWRTFWPLLWKPINPIYAAQTLEQSSPTLMNSLLSLLLFRRHRQQLAPTVYQALEQQAAARLSQVPVDTAVDRSAVLRLGYTLVVVVAIFALYRVLSPKNPITSASRVLLPWSSIRAPSRVQILDIRPGDTSVARGERLTISAEVHGLDEGEPVVLHYQAAIDGASTRDWQSGALSAPRLAIPMLALASTAPTNLHWQCQLADATHDGPGISHNGVEQNVRYWIEAGDARSAAYQVRVFARPTMVVKRLRYDYPAYTGYPPQVVVNTGDLDALEGTRVTLEGLSNQPIEEAFVDFDADGRHDMAMQISEASVSRDQARAQFLLALRPDRRTPRHTSYVLRFTTPSGRSNRHPPQYRIAVTPDYAPEIRLLESGQASHSGAFERATGTPEEIANVTLDQQITVKLEASDPDFALSKVRVVGYLEQAGINPLENPAAGTKRLDRVLLSNSHTGRLLGQTRFTPQQLNLHEGDVLVYWAEARDNRTPEANVSTTIPRKVQVTGSQSPLRPDSRQQGKRQAESDRPPNAGRPPADPASAAVDKDSTDRQQPQDGDAGGSSAGGESTDSDEADGGQAAAGESGEHGGAEGGVPAGDTGAGHREASSDQSGTSENNPDVPNPDQPGTGENNTGDKAAGESQGTDRKNGSSSAERQDGSSADSTPDGGAPTQPGESPDSRANDQGQPDSPPGRHDSAQERVSPEGDDDGTAFDRLREHFAAQEGDQKQPGKQEEQEGKPGQQGDPDASAGAQEKSGDNGQDQQPAPQQDPAGQGQQDRQDEPAGAQGESGGNAPGDNQQNGQSDPQQDQPGQGPPSNQQGAKGRPAGTEQEKGSDPRQPAEQEPSGAAGEMSPEQGTAGAGDSQSGEQTTPESQAARRPRDQQADDKEGKRPDDQGPPSVGRDQQESDSQGGQGGDRTGGGQEGAGGQADTEGTGGAGQHEAADDGSGQSAEPGTGQAGSQAGGDQQADSQTGQSSQNQSGDGSQPGRQADGQQPGQPQADGAPSAQRPAEQPEQKPDQQDTARARPDNSQGTPPAASSGPSEQPGETSPKNTKLDETTKTSGQSGAGHSPQNGGGDGGSDGPVPAGAEQEAAAGDAANLDYARQQTDLILNRLSDQLNRARIDPRLLDKLGWSQQELQRFVDRWKNLESLAAGTGDQAEAAQAELNAALRSLGLRKNRRMRYDSNHAKDNLRDLRDTYRGRIPASYLERVRAYVKGTTQGAGDREQETGDSNNPSSSGKTNK